MSRTITVVPAIAMAVLATAAAGAEVKLKAATFLPTQIIFAKFFGDWVKEVNKTCAGKVKVSVVGPATIKSHEQWSAVKSGSVDMHFGPAIYYKAKMPEAAILSLATNENPDQRKNGAWSKMNLLILESHPAMRRR